MRKILLVSFIALAGITLVSCEKDVDSVKPDIKLIAPEEDEAIKPGNEVHFDVEFSDNEALGSYKVNIHSNFDGHTHAVARAASANESGLNKTWEEKEFIAKGDEAIRGKKNAKIHHHHITIPTEIGGKPIKEGHYHFIVYCTDAAGNESFVAREIAITSSAEERDHH